MAGGLPDYVQELVMRFTKVAGALVAGLAVAGIIANLPEIKRYVRLFTI